MDNSQQTLQAEEKPESDKDLTAKALLSLKTKYSREHGWSTFFEVSLGGRQADFMAFNVYPSRNFCVVGCEVKASRSDWKRELEHCEKAEPLIIQCDEWYVVEAREGIVLKSELPDGWGLMTLRGDRLRKRAPSLLKEKSQLSREFVARIVEKSYINQESIPESVLYQAERRGYERGAKDPKDHCEIENLKTRVKIIDDLEAGDVKIQTWELRDVKRIRLALDFLKKIEGSWGYDDVANEIEHGVKSCEVAIQRLKESRVYFDKLKAEIENERTDKSL